VPRRARELGGLRPLGVEQELEELYTGPEFALEERYASVLTAVFVCMTYGAGMPLLIPVAAATLFVSFWVDKLSFFRLYRTPPTLGATASRIAAYLLPFAAFLHLSMSIWMFTSEPQFGQVSVDMQLQGDFHFR
jgi:hypothetical protein